jgi:glycerol-3-phosphate acyltransferase PlsY
VFLVLPVVAYLLGTFPSATLIARANGIDISTFGSGNPGASNVTRALGWRKGAWVYVLDALKGAIATGLGLGLDGRPLAYWCGAAAIVGHMFPLFRRFKGGKGAAAGSGVLLVLHPIIVPFALALWWIIAKVTEKAAVGSMVVLGLVPVGLAVLGRPAWEYLAIAGLSALILAKHWRNFVRIVKREEPALRGGS